MCSRSVGKLLVAVVVALATASCGLRIGEKQPEPPAPSYSGRGLSCVGQIPKNAEAYAKDQMSENEIDAFVLCIEKAFVSFAQLTRGRNHDSTYTPHEIRDFLQEYFVRSNRISDELMREFMVIKQAMVGGEVGVITRKELYLAVDVLEDLRKEAIRLKPFIKYLNPELAEKLDPDDLDKLGEHLAEANDALTMTIRTFCARLRKNKKVYPISNLANFLTHFRDFVRWDQHFAKAKPVEDWIRFLRIFKELTVGVSKVDAIQPSEWTVLLQAGSKWYLSYLQFRVGIKGKPIFAEFYEKGLQNTILLAREIFDQVEEAIGRQPDRKTITFAQIHELIAALHDLNWLPEGVTVESTDRSVEAVVSKIFGQTNEAPSARSSKGLTRESLALISHEFFAWTSIQWNLILNYRHSKPLNVRIPNLQQTPMLLPFEMSEPVTKDEDSAWQEFLHVTNLIPPLYRNKCEDEAVAQVDPDCATKEGRSQAYKVWIASKNDLRTASVRVDFHHLSMMNLLRSLSKLIFRGYSEDQSLRYGWKAGVRKEEMQAFYKDFREFGVKLKFFDPRNCKTGERSFIEGNLFTYGADGYSENEGSEKSLLTMSELMEFFAFLYSGGSMGKEVYEELKTKCSIDTVGDERGNSTPKDVQGNLKLNRSCVSQWLPTVIMGHIDHLPGLKRYLANLSNEERTRFALNQLETAFSPNSLADWVENSELAMVAVIMQYAEAVMTRYDRDGDGLLSKAEALEALPVFEGYIKKFALKTTGLALYPKTTRNAFLSILAYKKVPGILGVIREPGSMSLDRLELSEVFKLILRRLFDDEIPSASRVCE